MKKIIITISCIVLILLLRIDLNATIRLVPTDYSTIQAAINAASHGDTVLLYNKQTYTANVNINSKRIVLAIFN